MNEHIQIKGDDFNFEDVISLEMAGHIIQYIGNCQDRRAKGLPIHTL